MEDAVLIGGGGGGGGYGLPHIGPSNKTLLSFIELKCIPIYFHINNQCSV